MYGRQLAIWLQARLDEAGYEAEPVIAEDWGWCIMVARKPFMLWVGCGPMMDYTNVKGDDAMPAKEDVFWSCFAEAEVSLWKRLFKGPDTAPALKKLNGVLVSILGSEQGIQLVGVP